MCFSLQSFHHFLPLFFFVRGWGSQEQDFSKSILFKQKQKLPYSDSPKDLLNTNCLALRSPLMVDWACNKPSFR